MYNIDACGANYVVRNSTFREQRRHAILVRAPGGIIEGNTIEGLKAPCIQALFVDGLTISDNQF